jgi:hypothetical protein
MQTFNLRFGPATTPREKLIYNRLYPTLDSTRDRIREALGTKANPNDVGELFSNLTVDQLQGKGKEAPQPPKPNNQ